MPERARKPINPFPLIPIIPFKNRGRTERNRIASAAKDQARTMVVDQYHAPLSQNSPRDTLSITPIPILGSKVADATFLDLGIGLMGNQGRIRRRMSHSRFKWQTGVNTRTALSRMRINSLNLDGRMPLIEHILTIVQSSKDFKKLSNSPVVGGIVDAATGIGLPFLKLLSHDTLRAKVTSFVVDPILGAVQGAMNESLVGTYFSSLVSPGRYEEGSDAADQIADIGKFIADTELLKHEGVSARRKRNIANGFVRHYEAIPPGRQEEAHPAVQVVAGKVSEGAATIDKGLRRARRWGVGGIPGVGIIKGGTKLAKGLAAEAKPVRSMKDVVDEVLGVDGQQGLADRKIAEISGQIDVDRAKGSRNPLVRDASDPDDRIALVTWQYRKTVATVLNNLYIEANKYRTTQYPN